MEQTEFAQLAVLKKQALIRNEYKDMQSSLKCDILILFVFWFLVTVIFLLFPMLTYLNLSFSWMWYNFSTQLHSSAKLISKF